MSYRTLGDYSKAIECFETLISIDSTNQFSIINSYMNIALMFTEMEMYDQAIETFYELPFNSLPDNPIKATLFNNLGETYIKSNSPDSAQKYFQNAIVVANSINQNQLGIISRLELAELFIAKGELIAAINQIKSADHLLKRYKRPDLQIMTNEKYAAYYQVTGQYDSVDFYGKEIIKTANAIRRPNLIRDTYQTIAVAYESKGSVSESNFYLKKHTAFKDSLQKALPFDLHASARSKYMVNQKEKDLAKAKSESSFFRSIGNNLIILSLILLLVLGLVVFKLKKSRGLIAENEAEKERIIKEVEKH